MKNHKLEVILVNLISFDYLVRYQAPLPVNTLAGYLKINTTDVEVTVVDMQKVFDELGSAGKSSEDNFNRAIAYTIERIRSSSQNTPVIVGLSMKWATQEVQLQLSAVSLLPRVIIRCSSLSAISWQLTDTSIF